MHAGTGLQEGAETGHHRGLHALVGQWVARACRMAAYNVVLQGGEIGVINAPLRHRPETGVDAVDNLVRAEFFQKVVAFRHFVHRQVGKSDFPSSKDNFFHIRKSKNRIHPYQIFSPRKYDFF